MKEKIIVSDFDGTITKQDTLSTFLKTYADVEWLELEAMWERGDIGSAECLTKQFNLVPNISPEMIEEFLDTIQIDEHFKEYNEIRLKNNIDFVILSDSIDYFIKKILQKSNIKNVEVISNHGEFQNGEFIITYPNKNPLCKKVSGTCKCNTVKNLRTKYKQIYYVGDGTSDICVADKADYLFAKSTLLNYCRKEEIRCIEYKTYKEVVNYDGLGFNI